MGLPRLQACGADARRRAALRSGAARGTAVLLATAAPARSLRPSVLLLLLALAACVAAGVCGSARVHARHTMQLGRGFYAVGERPLLLLLGCALSATLPHLASAQGPSMPPPNPPPVPLDTAFQSGLVMWYDLSSFNSGTQVWSSRVSASTATFGNTPTTVATDAANGGFGNTCPLSFISGTGNGVTGPPNTVITFPEVLNGGTKMSMCTVRCVGLRARGAGMRRCWRAHSVGSEAWSYLRPNRPRRHCSRYTSPTLRKRIFQGKTVDFTHGAFRWPHAPRPVHLSTAMLSLTPATCHATADNNRLVTPHPCRAL
jgi:hypothetical protein